MSLNKTAKSFPLDEIDLRRGEKGTSWSNLSIYYTWKNKKKLIKNKFKISVPTWNGEFKSPDKSYLISDIKDFLEYILKKMKVLIVHQ